MTTPIRKIDRRATLQQQGLINPGVGLVRDQRFQDNDFFDPHDLVQVRYEMLRSARLGEQTAANAATSFGVSRATYYQVHAAFEQQGMAGLIPSKRGPHGAHKLTHEVLDYVEKQLQKDRGLSTAELVQLVQKAFQLLVHPRSLERALQRQKKNAAWHASYQPSTIRPRHVAFRLRAASQTSTRSGFRRVQRGATAFLPAWFGRVAKRMVRTQSGSTACIDIVCMPAADRSRAHCKYADPHRCVNG